MRTQLFRRAASLMLCAAMLVCMTPAAASGADGSEAAANVKKSGSPAVTTASDGPAFAEGQAVVLYEEDAVDTDAPARIMEKRAARRALKARSFGSAAASEGKSARTEADNTLGQQAQILEKSLGRNYQIEDTVVLTDEDNSSEKVISVVSSENLSTEALVSKLRRNDKISIAEPNYIYHASGMPAWNDTYLDDEWQLSGSNGINADKAWSSGAYRRSAGSGAEPVVVAVLDTGIDYNHPDLRSRMWTRPNSKAFSRFKGRHGYDFVYSSDDPMDGNGHGTHCSGIIAGAADNGAGVAGIAGDTSKVQLLAVRVLDESGSGTLEDIAAGFKYIIRLRQAGANIRAINCSLGAPITSDIFDALIEQAGKEGILTIAAAGNESADNDVVPSSPANAKSDYVVSVAATDDDGSLASYSNFGRKAVDIAAPGSNILSDVSYENYAPYLYDTNTLRKTSEYYGEFGGAKVTRAVNAQNEEVDTVKPVPGTDYNGDPVTGVGEFGSAVLLANRVSGSKGRSTLELTGDRGFGIGNNSTSLRWKITGARSGDTYILYFPYEKLAGDPYDINMNLAFRPHTEEDGGGTGTLDIGDVRINGVDKHNAVDWSSVNSDEYGFSMMDIDPTWNSIWQASGTTEVFYPYSSIKGMHNNMLSAGSADTGADADSPAADAEPQDSAYAQGYGLGMVYQATGDGDLYFDISSLGISKHASELGDASFGCYDVYSGTSMAAPVVTGSVALLSVMDPSMSIDQVKSTLFSTVRGGYDGWCSTGGIVDFARYSQAAVSSAPAVSGVTADFSKKTVTLKGRGFGTSPSVTVKNNISGASETIPASDLRASDSSIVISNAGAKSGPGDKTHHGLIGSDITFTVRNNGKSGHGTFYVVKGLTPYSDGYDIGMIVEDIFDFFSKGAGSSSEDPRPEEPLPEEPLPEDPAEEPLMPDGLSFLTGANDLYMYDKSGTIYHTVRNEASGKYQSDVVGTMMEDGVKQYVKDLIAEEDAAAEKDKTINKDDDLWRPDNPRQLSSLDWFTLSVVGNPVYMGGSVYELVHADLRYRDAYLLVGMRLDDEMGTWRVFYDSLSGLGTAPVELDFSRISTTTLAAYKGRLYLLGSVLTDDTGSSNDTSSVEEEISNSSAFTEKDIQMDVFSCSPVRPGISWKKEQARFPAPRAAGYAVSQGGKLYYVLSSTNDDIDYNVYRYDGKSWSKAGKLPPALYKGETGSEVIDLGFFQMYTAGYTGIPCAVSIDSKGILFGGMSFDGVGDTFRFNTATGRTEPLGYTLWGDTADRATCGTAAGNRFWVHYKNDSEERFTGKNIPVRTGFVRLARTVSGDGTGIVTGGEYCPKGESTDVTIVPDKGCYIYSIASTQVSPLLTYDEITSRHAKTVTKRQKAVKTTFRATSDGTLDVVFGKISTGITAKKTMTRAVGKRDLGIYTDGTISGVRLKSSNTKYARVNKDGTVTFRKAGVGKTVTMTATSLDNPELKATCKVKIVSRKAKKFRHGKYKVSFRTKVLCDKPLGKAYAPRKLKARSLTRSKAVKLTWKKGSKSKGLKGYIVLRKTGKGRYTQIARLRTGRTSFIDKKVLKGKTYRYIVVGYKLKDDLMRVTPARSSVKITLRRLRTLTRSVGTRSIRTYPGREDGDLVLKSSNTRYARVNRNGTVTFRKAGVGKTVTLTASLKDNPDLKTSYRIRIVSRSARKFRLGKYRVSFRKKVQKDDLLAGSFAPKKLRTKYVSRRKAVRLTWKKGSKSEGLGGCIVLRKTGKGRYTQIAKLKAGKTSYVDRKVSRGRKYRYIVVGYRTSGRTLRVSPARASSAVRTGK